MSEDGVADDQELAQAGDQGEPLGLAGGQQAVVAGAQDGLQWMAATVAM